MDRSETATMSDSARAETRASHAPRPSRMKALRAVSLALCLSCLLCACAWFEEKFEARQFVGTWKSSRAETPIQLYGNGEWEMRAADGTVLQYGIWQLVDKDILWSRRNNGEIRHESNAILSVSPREFKLRERNGSATTFVRID